MAHSPALRPDPSEPMPAPLSDPETTMANEPDVGEITTDLAAQGIESSELALDLILHDIAERARQATGASGAAIGLERDGSMVCRAAAGETAPDLGVRINTESGLTGACIREERAQWCPNTDADDRVDAEACRQLQVRSIVVVPLFARERVIGVFEIFSGQARAFGERELRALQELAIWVTEAIKGGSPKGMQLGQAPAEAARPESPPTRQSGAALRNLLAESFASAGVDDRGTKVLRAVVLGLAVLLLVLLGYRWGWQKARVAKQLNTAPVTTSAFDESGQLSGGEQSLTLGSGIAKPSPSEKRQLENENGPPARQTSGAVSTPGARSADGPTGRKENASDREVLSEDSNDTRGTKVISPETAPPRPADQRSPTVEAPVPPPSPVISGVTAAVLPPLSAHVPEGPASLGVPVSRGVTPGRLIRRVNPTYPSIALQQRISGPVQLEARIGTDGHVHNIKVLKGHPFLATAAIDAVRQWQYEPYKLNGQAVDLQTQITINFNLP
jgi:TonB family protein